MCGLAGIIAPKPELYIEAMTAAIAHRGPDDFGHWHDSHLALGHRRLSIQDLSANGHQPMWSADKRYVLVYNGEIYNHWDIREGLQGKYAFQSSSDTETLLYALIDEGPMVLKRVNGIFAFAFYDTQTKQLLLARDHFGIKPLYLYTDKGHLLFASEIKAFLAFPEFEKQLDPEALAQYLSFLWSPGAKTPFAKVKKLAPGHYMQIDVTRPETARTARFYEIPFSGKYSADTEASLVKSLQEHLLAAVERQLLSDVPVGFFLSGGLDSSAVVAMARQLRPNAELPCYTIDTGEKATTEDGFSSDLPYARRVAEHLKVPLHVVSADVDILRDFDRMIWHLDEPQADPAPLHVLNICRQARQDGIVVLLGGAGGDDLFSGYRRHQAITLNQYIDILPAFLRKLAAGATKAIPGHHAVVRRIRKVGEAMSKDTLERMAAYFTWLDTKTVKGLFGTAYRQELNTYQPLHILTKALQNIPEEHNLLNQMLYWELKYFLSDHNLNYTDKMSMAVGVEVRVPFLDLELVEFSTRIPPRLKMKGNVTKYLFRKAMEPFLPHDVIYRSKAGFGAPVRHWIRHEMQDRITTTLSAGQIQEQGIFDASAVGNLLQNNASGKVDAAYSILCLLAIESWRRQFERF
ncbi:MAG: asparagine synthase (glutamine-hydrolyzing) [Chitinophagales bacterium]|nr:asparagine synthase (glutamine-hydrolyzing) [Chitinophagales bacterium]